MKYMDKKHRKLIKKLEDFWQEIQKIQHLGKKYGIDDIFQDNGAKILQQMILMNFQPVAGRLGNDAIDSIGVEWEMKSANVEKVSGFSTHHHLNLSILKKYRSVPWSFAIYKHTQLKSIYVMTPKKLTPFFIKWEISLRKKNHTLLKQKSLNNPKIPIKFIEENGYRVYPYGRNSVNPADISKTILER